MAPTASGYHHLGLKSALLDAARAELAERGVRGFSLRSAAGRAGVSRAAPYRHFPDKAALLAALMAQGFSELRAALAEADGREGAADSAERLIAQGEAYLEFGRRRPELLELIFSGEGFAALRAGTGPAAAQAADAGTAEGVAAGGGAAQAAPDLGTFDILERRVAACQAEGSLEAGVDSRTLAALVWSTVHGIAVLEREGLFADLGPGGPGPEPGGPGPGGVEAGLLAAFDRVFLRRRDSTSPAQAGYTGSQ